MLQRSKAAEILDALGRKGFAVFDPIVCDVDASGIYASFDELEAFVMSEEAAEDVRRVDAHLMEFIKSRNTPLIKDSIRLSRLVAPFETYQITSYQYFHGVCEFVQSRVTLPGAVRRFWRGMRALLELCDTQLLPSLGEVLESSKVLEPIATLLKVWKYTPVAGNRFLIPVHFDRSILPSAGR